ncbi:MAG: hypothetical protein AAB849_02165 [Patescibacteria group bacterium]
MDQEIKQEFQTLKQNIEDLAIAVSSGFQNIEERMATKEDLKAFATKDDLETFKIATKDDFKQLENKMDAEFSSVRSEIRSEISEVRKDIKDLREEVKNNFNTETEDIGAVYKDVDDLKRRMILVEARP